MKKDIKIYFATKLRGFFKHISQSEKSNIVFFSDKNVYEVNNKYKLKLLKIYRSELFNKLGVIRQIKSKEVECDYIGSFNRFLKSNKDYFIYLENPTALYEYCIGRNNSYLGKKRIEKLINDPKLRGIVCMSNACYSTLDTVLCEIPKEVVVTQIYPYIPINEYANVEYITRKAMDDKLKCLYIAQGQRFISKGVLEVIEAFERIKDNYNNVKLTIITNLDGVNKDIIKKIKSNNNIELLDFNLNYKELQKIYNEAHILLQPTSDDSSPSTILEAIKSGLCVISTTLYAIPEMVINEFNGYLTQPKYYLFDENNIPNEKVWNNRDKTIYSISVDERIVEFLVSKITMLNNNRDKLKEMSINSLNISNNEKFGEEIIIQKWNEFFELLKRKG